MHFGVSIERLRGRPLYRLMSMSCAIAFMMFGYDAGVLGGVQSTAPFLEAIGNPTGSYVIPMVASSYTLGAFIMSLLVASFGKPLGRRGCIMLGDCFVIVGGALQASSWSLPQIIIARVLCGFGIGLIAATVPTYMAEMSIESGERGPEVAIQCIYLINGAAIAYWIDFGTTRLNNQFSWRFPIALQSLFASLSFCGMFFLPDTPRWYYDKGRHGEGDSVLGRLHNRPIDSEIVQIQRQEIISVVELEKDLASLNPLALIWDTTELKAGRRIRISFLILAIQQMMGINAAVYFTVTILTQIGGLSSFNTQLIAACMNTSFAMGTWFLPSTIERFGRRPILFWSAAAIAVTLAVFIAMQGLSHKTAATQWTAVAFLFIYNFLFGYGWIGVPWLYGPEIAPLKYRHYAGSAAASGEWLITFITVFAGGIGLERVGWPMWFWWMIMSAVACVFVYFVCPESGGKTLEEIDSVFMENAGYGSIFHGPKRTVHAEAMDPEKADVIFTEDVSKDGKH